MRFQYVKDIWMGAQGPRDGLQRPMSIHPTGPLQAPPTSCHPHGGLSQAWHSHAPTLKAALALACRAHVTRATMATPPCVSPPGPQAPAPAPPAASVPTSGPVPWSLCLDTCTSRGGVPRPLPVTPRSSPPLPCTPLPQPPACPSPLPAPSLNKDVAWRPAQHTAWLMASATKH